MISLSGPQEFGVSVSDEEVKAIKAPKLFMASENDDPFVTDARHMYAIAGPPKRSTSIPAMPTARTSSAATTAMIRLSACCISLHTTRRVDGQSKERQSWRNQREEEHELAYLENREAHMQYPTYQETGWPIGSGMVESANKLVVEARLIRRSLDFGSAFAYRSGGESLVSSLFFY